jgi:hypothetical protein
MLPEDDESHRLHVDGKQVKRFGRLPIVARAHRTPIRVTHVGVPHVTSPAIELDVILSSQAIRGAAVKHAAVVA